MKNTEKITRIYSFIPLMIAGLLLFSEPAKTQYAELHIALKNLSPFEIFLDGEYYSAKNAFAVEGIRPGYRQLKVVQRRGNGVNQTRTVTLYEGKINLPKNTITSVMVRESGKLKVKQTKVIRPGLQPGSRNIYT